MYQRELFQSKDLLRRIGYYPLLLLLTSTLPKLEPNPGGQDAFRVLAIDNTPPITSDLGIRAPKNDTALYDCCIYNTWGDFSSITVILVVPTKRCHKDHYATDHDCQSVPPQPTIDKYNLELRKNKPTT